MREIRYTFGVKCTTEIAVNAGHSNHQEHDNNTPEGLHTTSTVHVQKRRGNIQITRSSSLHSPPTHHLCQWNGNTSRGFCERPKRIHPLTKYVCRRENGNDGQVGNIGEKCGQKDSELLSGVHHHLPGNGRQNPETGKLLHWQILTNYLRTDCNVPD